MDEQLSPGAQHRSSQANKREEDREGCRASLAETTPTYCAFEMRFYCDDPHECIGLASVCVFVCHDNMALSIVLK